MSEKSAKAEADLTILFAKCAERLIWPFSNSCCCCLLVFVFAILGRVKASLSIEFATEILWLDAGQFDCCSACKFRLLLEIFRTPCSNTILFLGNLYRSSSRYKSCMLDALNIFQSLVACLNIFGDVDEILFCFCVASCKFFANFHLDRYKDWIIWQVLRKFMHDFKVEIICTFYWAFSSSR